MDAPVLSPDEVRELADLRRRAYGPRADIGDDPVALSRLEELEAALRPPAAAPPVIPTYVQEPSRPPADTAAGELPSRPEGGAQESLSPSADVAATQEDPAEPGSRRFPRITRGWWIAAGAAVTLVAVVVWAVSAITGPRADAALAVVPTADDTGDVALAQGFLGSYGITPDSIVQYQGHRNLTAWSAPTDEGGTCLVIESERFGVVGVSCTPPGLDPTADVTVFDRVPGQFLEGVEPGTVIRFVLSGDRVLVWERAPLIASAS